MKIHTLWLSASALALAWSGVASAQTTASASRDTSGATVQELIVTAERRNENLQQTAIAATVLTGKDLQKQGIVTVDQLQFISPSLTVNNFGQGNDFDIRGIGKGEHNSQTGTGVVTYRDGVATFPGYFQEEPYYDIAGVEILRGPQGTFSGQNATGGAVIVNTVDPKINGGYTGYIQAQAGNYGDWGLQGAVNLPISDTLAARVAFNTEERNSFYHISGPWTGDPGLKWGSARFSLLWTPTDKLKVLWKTDYNYLDNGGYFGDSLTTPGTSSLFTFANNYKTYATDQFVRSIVKVDYTLDNGIDLRSISGYQQGRTAWTGDIDGTAAAAPNYIIAEAVNERIWSQEFNIISPDKGPFGWVLGAYYQNNRYDFPVGLFDIGVPPGVVDEDLNGVNPTYTAAVFGQASWNWDNGLQLQVGARYSKWSTTNRAFFTVPEFGLNFPQNQTEEGNNVTGKVALNWNVNADNFLYAFVASGAKPGGLNTALYFAGGGVPAPFGQEYVTDYELGWKSTLLDNHLRTQLGVYYNSFEHFQVSLPIPSAPTQVTEQNVPNPTKLYGVEASAQAVFGDFSFNVGLGLEHSELGTFYTEDPRLPAAGTCNPTTGPATAACINLAGKPQTYAPDFTFNVYSQYVFHLADQDTLTPAVSYSHISDQWATLFDNRAAGDYLTARDILGASLAWQHGDITATLYGSNLSDDKYVAAVVSPIRIAGPPRQFGIRLLKTF
ncbi:TonB-dependent receptor [Phenylobacterium sp.]|uniref:TonB-dependent receptor n=1 Tax=Phenylobacterium sp. TaxID=1871053 RepID=UPI001206B342|nr:TonB-dependent receptor [Phenylobacterium sp.]THD59641.1 MAG: TonB-dependent receptor [Phenylobacterium sp.]